MATVRPFGDIEHAIVPPGAGARRQSHESCFPDQVVFLKKKEVTNVHITSSVWLQRWTGSDFPLFSDELMEAYNEYSLSNVNPFIFAPIILLYCAFIVCRLGLMGLRFGKIHNY